MRIARLNTWIFTAILVFLFFPADSRSVQIPATFRAPILGHVLDRNLHAIRPIVGILGSSRVEAPLDLGFSVREAAFLTDQVHAIVASSDIATALVLDLEVPSRSSSIAGATSSASMIRISRDGTSAGLYDSEKNQLLLVGGLPSAPDVRATIDLSFEGHVLRGYAISNDGAVALLAFGGEESDTVYSWTSSAGPHFVTNSSKVSDLAFIDDDAVLADAGSNQVFLLRSVQNQASPVLIADSHDGVEGSAFLSISSRNEIYIGSTHEVLVLDATGHKLRSIECNCTVTTMAPLRESAIRLTDALNQPVFVLDGRRSPEQVLFIPALSVTPEEVR